MPGATSNVDTSIARYFPFWILSVAAWAIANNADAESTAEQIKILAIDYVHSSKWLGFPLSSSKNLLSETLVPRFSVCSVVDLS